MFGHPMLPLLVALVLVTAMGPLAMQIFLPALPAIQVGFGVPTGVAQLVLSLSTLSIALATLAYGPAADRLGRRPVLVGGIIIYLAGSALCVIAADIWMLIGGRIIQAAGGAAGFVLARTVVRDLFGVDRSAAVLAYLTMAMVTAPMIAPALGGALTDALGWRAVFAASGLFGLVALAGIVWRLPETLPDHARGRSARMLAAFGLLLRSRSFCGFAFQSAFAVSLFYGFMSGAPFIVLGVLEQPATLFGLMFVLVSIAFMIGNLVAARYSTRVGIVRMVRFGSLAVLFGSLIGLAVALLLPWSMLALFIPMTAIALAQGVAIPNSQAGAIAVAPQLAGAASGLSGFLQMALAAITAQLVGMAQDGTPYPTLIAMCLCAGGAFLSSLAARTAHDH
jgi:DHA1 family bicyclomycin/chloramphenicol resistance-like MFS transporter